MISTLAALGFAAASYSNTIQLVVESTNSTLNNRTIESRFVSDYHFYAYTLGNTAQNFHYDGFTSSIEQNTIDPETDTPTSWRLFQSPVLQSLIIATYGDPDVNLVTLEEDNYIAINETTDYFYACSDLIFNFGEVATEDHPALTVIEDGYHVPDHCQKVKVKGVFV